MKEQTIYALGYFDGVHLGHRALLDCCSRLAAAHGCRSGAVTFSAHPQSLICGNAPAQINTLSDRIFLLQQAVEHVEVLPFDRELLQTPWQDFLRFLVEEKNAAGFVCGSDFRFGAGSEGTAEMLERFCQEHKLVFQAVPQQYVDGIRVSSTHIRSLLESGQLEQANRFLGHPHLLSGTVGTGKQLGRTIGIPTANLPYPMELLALPRGVYAGRVWVGETPYTALTNIGTRPTVNGEGILVESHLIDFTGDLYGKTVRLELFGYLRPECKFRDLTHLKKQIEKDKFSVEKFMQNNQLHP